MEWLFYGLVAVFIAVVLSSVELLTKYQSRSPMEIFGSWHYVSFASLNAVFCFGIYWALPYLSDTLLKDSFPIDIKTGIGRAIAAGLGYLFIVRLSLLDMTTKAGETYGVGFDGIYNGLANYILRQHNGRIRRKIRQNFFELYSAVNGAISAFEGAAKLLRQELDATDRVTYDKRLRLVQTDSANVPEKALALYLLIRDHTTGKEEAHSLVEKSA